jgi:heptosyltransferase-2
LQKFLIIQTAFIGDVVLATPVIEKLHAFFPDAQIDFLLRKGNEALLLHHPYLHEVLIWDKKKQKQRNLFRLLRRIRKSRYDKVINLQRFAATGFLTAFSAAKETIGFDKNPFSFLFSVKVAHVVGKGVNLHETERNLELVKSFTDSSWFRPALYPSAADFDFIKAYTSGKFITISPASVWFTKQYPKEQWISFIKQVPPEYRVLLLGGPGDIPVCESIRNLAGKDFEYPGGNQNSPYENQRGSRENQPGIDEAQPENRARQVPGAMDRIEILAGKLSFLQSAALMKSAEMNYVNDSAPMHFASAMNAPVTAVYCSTVPAFGFGPLSDIRFIVQHEAPLYCRPCGLHGFRQCPEKHFRCAKEIRDGQLLITLPGPGSLAAPC